MTPDLGFAPTVERTVEDLARKALELRWAVISFGVLDEERDDGRDDERICDGGGLIGLRIFGNGGRCG